MLIRLSLCNVLRALEADQALTPSEVSDLRGLQWISVVALQPRRLPWIEAELSILQGAEHTVGDNEETQQVAAPGPAVMFSFVWSFMVIELLLCRGKLFRRCVGRTTGRRKPCKLSHVPCRRRVLDGSSESLCRRVSWRSGRCQHIAQLSFGRCASCR